MEIEVGSECTNPYFHAVSHLDSWKLSSRLEQIACDRDLGVFTGNLLSRREEPDHEQVENDE